MTWTLALIEYWVANYYALIDYELNPFEEIRIWGTEPYITGKGHQAPYEETCDLNWEFDKALTKLQERGKIFREVYLDGGLPTEDSKQVYDEFCRILIRENE